MPPRKSVIFCTITPSDQQAENQKRRCTPSTSPIRNVLRTPRFTSTPCIAATRRLARVSESRTPRASLGFPRVQHNQMERQNGASGATLKQRRKRVGGAKRAFWPNAFQDNAGQTPHQTAALSSYLLGWHKKLTVSPETGSESFWRGSFGLCCGELETALQKTRTALRHLLRICR